MSINTGYLWIAENSSNKAQGSGERWYSRNNRGSAGQRWGEDTSFGSLGHRQETTNEDWSPPGLTRPSWSSKFQPLKQTKNTRHKTQLIMRIAYCNCSYSLFLFFILGVFFTHLINQLISQLNKPEHLLHARQYTKLWRDSGEQDRALLP